MSWGRCGDAWRSAGALAAAAYVRCRCGGRFWAWVLRAGGRAGLRGVGVLGLEAGNRPDRAHALLRRRPAWWPAGPGAGVLSAPEGRALGWCSPNPSGASGPPLPPWPAGLSSVGSVPGGPAAGAPWVGDVAFGPASLRSLRFSVIRPRVLELRCAGERVSSGCQVPGNRRLNALSALQEGRPGHFPCAGRWIALLCETVRAVRGHSSRMRDGSLEVRSRLGVEA